VTKLVAAAVAVGLLVPAIAEGTPSASCVVTKRSKKTFPAPRGMWYSNGRLATSAYGVIFADRDHVDADGSIARKFPWWGFRVGTSRLRLGGRRLDASAPPLRASVHEGGIVGPHRVGTRFWASTLRFPTAGCWRITGRVGRRQLSLVVRVDAAP
jgi:hypothetical protein